MMKSCRERITLFLFAGFLTLSACKTTDSLGSITGAVGGAALNSLETLTPEQQKQFCGQELRTLYLCVVESQRNSDFVSVDEAVLFWANTNEVGALAVGELSIKAKADLDKKFRQDMVRLAPNSVFARVFLALSPSTDEVYLLAPNLKLADTKTGAVAGFAVGFFACTTAGGGDNDCSAALAQAQAEIEENNRKLRQNAEEFISSPFSAVRNDVANGDGILIEIGAEEEAQNTASLLAARQAMKRLEEELSKIELSDNAESGSADEAKFAELRNPVVDPGYRRFLRFENDLNAESADSNSRPSQAQDEQ